MYLRWLMGEVVENSQLQSTIPWVNPRAQGCSQAEAENWAADGVDVAQMRSLLNCLTLSRDPHCLLMMTLLHNRLLMTTVLQEADIQHGS